jgi:acyl carrier protein
MNRSEIDKTARGVIADFLRVDENEIKTATHIVNDLGADSLALVELGFLLSEKFFVKITNDDDALLEFGRLVDYIAIMSGKATSTIQAPNN